LILDEPTDGFSSHQLDKVREVLEALNSKQTLIVSHESKMESFVDHIVKIRKHEHASEVV
jgi:DNA repair exonuclease SbcCD ATPase subunit